MIPIFSCKVVEVPSGTGDFLRLLVGELVTPKLAKIFTYGKWLYPYIMRTWGIRSGPKMSENAPSEDECTFPPNIFAPPPKITQKPPFNAKPIIQRAVRQSHVNGATMLKLYSYIGIGRYLGICQNFSFRGRLGVQGPLM